MMKHSSNDSLSKRRSSSNNARPRNFFLARRRQSKSQGVEPVVASSNLRSFNDDKETKRKVQDSSTIATEGMDYCEDSPSNEVKYNLSSLVTKCFGHRKKNIADSAYISMDYYEPGCDKQWVVPRGSSGYNNRLDGLASFFSSSSSGDDNEGKNALFNQDRSTGRRLHRNASDKRRRRRPYNDQICLLGENALNSSDDFFEIDKQQHHDSCEQLATMTRDFIIMDSDDMTSYFNNMNNDIFEMNHNISFEQEEAEMSDSVHDNNYFDLQKDEIAPDLNTPQEEQLQEEVEEEEVKINETYSFDNEEEVKINETYSFDNEEEATFESAPYDETTTNYSTTDTYDETTLNFSSATYITMNPQDDNNCNFLGLTFPASCFSGDYLSNVTETCNVSSHIPFCRNPMARKRKLEEEYFGRKVQKIESLPDS